MDTNAPIIVLLVVLIVILIFVSLFLFNKKTNLTIIDNNKVIKSQKEELNQLEKKLSNVHFTHNSMSERVQELINQTRQINDSIEEQKSQIADKIKSYEEEQQRLSNKHIESIKEMELAKIKIATSEFARMEEDFLTKRQQREAELMNLQEVVDKQIVDFVDKRDALIEAAKKEERDKQEEIYHTLQLNDNEVKDILLLNEVLDNLSNKDAIAKVIWSVYVLPRFNELIKRLNVSESSSGIYKITNNLNHKVYIGKSARLKTRFLEHLKNALSYNPTQEIHKDMNSCGIWNYSFDIIELCDKDKLSEREKFYIDLYNSEDFGFNRNSGG